MKRWLQGKPYWVVAGAMFIIILPLFAIIKFLIFTDPFNLSELTQTVATSALLALLYGATNKYMYSKISQGK